MGPDRIRPHDAAWTGPMIGATVPPTNRDRCLNLVHRDVGCLRCAGACPTGAIAMDRPAPSLSPDSCIGCGACIAVCPTDVFGPHDRTERTLLRSVEQAQPKELGVVCARRSDPSGAPLGVESVVAHTRCLGSLDEATLLGLSAGGSRPLVLDDSLCDTCPIGSLHSVIVARAQAANALLSGSEPVRLASAEPSGTPPDEIIEGGRPWFTRRALFRSLREEATGLVDRDGPLPASRRRLLTYLDSVDVLGTALAPLADVRVDPGRCTACGLCSKFCPTDALEQDTGEDVFSITFLPAICLDCGVCAVACPDDAILFGDRVEYLADRRALVSGNTTPCESCSTATAASPGEDGRVLCTWCRRGAGTVKPLVDEAGLLDDLLHRMGDTQVAP